MRRSYLLCLAVSASAALSRAQLSVTSTVPVLGAGNVDASSTILVNFDRAVAPTSLPPAANDVHLFASVGGAVAATYTLENGGQTLRIVPARPFEAGEIVALDLDHDLRAVDATVLRSAGYQLRFRVRTRAASLAFQQVQDLSLRDSPSVSVRIYGGNAADLDHDGFADLPMACEDAHDVRVVLNRADCSANFLPHLVPTNPVGGEPSPNEVADFDLDGETDVCTANPVGSSVTVLLGRGDGTFDPGVSYAAGSGPHGLAVFDADGDGDPDVATANTGSNNCSFLRNVGGGVLAAPVFFEGGGSGEWSMTAGDMNADGIVDLVVGAQASSRLIVHLGNGDGTFTAQPFANAGGHTWMIGVGDVDGDGNLDVATANSDSGNGAILLGNGLGGLGAPVTVATAGFPIATDLGDLDGDGDLDWELSQFVGSVHELYVNDGTGHFTLAQSFPALSNAACAAFADLDEDLDLDLVLFDEIADRIRVFKNGVPAGTPTCFGDGSGGACPCGNSGASGHGCANSVEPAGALLVASGTTSPDTLALCAGGMPATALTIFIKGDVAEPVPVAFGDGLRCAGGALVRFGQQAASHGVAVFPGAFPTSVSVAGGTPPGSGTNAIYQAYYRNAVAAFCPPATANVSNGVQVVW